MDDLISRQAAIKALEDAGITNYLATGDFYGIINALTVIKNLPAAEPTEEQVKEFCIRRNLALIAVEDIETIRRLSLPAEPKKGRWIEDGYTHYKAVCDQCGEPCATYVLGKPRDKYCKYCGAKMEDE